MKNTQIRQGDVFLIKISEKAAPPLDAEMIKRDKGRVVLAYGEVTGHAHAITEEWAQLFESLNGEKTLVIFPDERKVDVVRPVLKKDLRYSSGFKKIGEIEEKVAGALLTHEEHSAHVLSPGTYKVVIQCEYVPKALPRNVRD